MKIDTDINISCTINTLQLKIKAMRTNFCPLRGMDTLSGEKTLSDLFYLPSEKGSTLKGKNFLPLGENSFFLE